MDFIEPLVIGFTIALIFSIILGFIAFMRYIAQKEKRMLAEYNKEKGAEK